MGLWSQILLLCEYVNERTPETYSGVASMQHQASIIIELKKIIIKRIRMMELC